jgi:superoxide dismutase, Cu-Zn family
MNAICVFDPQSSFNQAKIKGYITFHQCNSITNTCITINLEGLPPNSTHAIHIHEEGDLSKGCESLCAHYNPHKKLHGNFFLHKNDRHVGDLINNITSDSNGMVKLYFYDDLARLYEPYSIIGRSIVIHEKRDDLGAYRNENTIQGIESGKTGNAGKRIACSIIGRTKTNHHCVDRL